MADADPIKQLQHLLDDPGKVLEKISWKQIALGSAAGALANPDATGAIYDRIAASLRALKMQIAERTRPLPTNSPKTKSIFLQQLSIRERAA